MKKRRYALLDWDNTLRDGFLLFSWIDYLVRNSVVGATLQYEIDECRKKYRSGEISYTDLSIKSVECYSRHMAGLSVTQIEFYLDDYLKKDDQDFFSFVPALFDLLTQWQIEPIIISGSPKMIIERYSERFNLANVFAVELGISHGIHTGELISNYGHGKGTIVRQLIDTYHCTPLLAFGDSLADMPMMEEADIGFWVGGGHGEIDMKSRISFSPLNPNDAIIKMIHNKLDNYCNNI